MLNKTKAAFNTFLTLGVHRGRTPEVNRQIFVINLFSIVGLCIVSALALSAYIRQEFVLAVVLTASSIAMYISHRLVEVTKPFTGYRVAGNFLLYCLMLLMAFLVVTGGRENTGPLWIFLVPPVALFFGGLKKGLRDIGLFTSVIFILLFLLPDTIALTQYSYGFKSRLLLSFLTLTFLAGFYEYSRSESYKRMKQLSDEFERQARSDSLTKLPNRRSMREHLDYEFSRSQRAKQTMSVMLCDIDHFKSINDEHGHDGGDYTLIELSQLFRDTLRKQDIVARWGGEEFIFLLPETNQHDAYILAEKLRKRVENYGFKYKGTPFTLTVSIGIAEVEHHLSVDKAISLADHFMYQAKREGRNKTLPIF
ncbi:GGDEF domain-containing protein [Aestuariibacter sp. AA17]|uniref:diguanylate cyclase n=1 Tax=Fluctibacter corallii TaxID=2984329 RepID=A0ABT3ABE9_9ALTE|nr:GGDEF domain-containing protein [Aestuariibacter sp. AA17]MCV2885998.1 GGDEF domain-containing protein [Aestuariibacter sp. AA17]